jgi:uncharacterized Zn finger protein (UPF0148 family)
MPESQAIDGDDGKMEGKNLHPGLNSKSSVSSRSSRNSGTIVSSDDTSWISQAQKEEFEVMLCDDNGTKSSVSSSIHNSSTCADSKSKDNAAGASPELEHEQRTTQHNSVTSYSNTEPSNADSQQFLGTSSHSIGVPEESAESSRSTREGSYDRKVSKEKIAVDLAISQSESFLSHRSDLSKPATMSKSKKQHEKNNEFCMPEYAEVRQVATKVLASKMVKGYSLSNHQCEACSMPMLQLHDELVTTCFVCETLHRKHQQQLQKKEQNRHVEREDGAEVVAPIAREALPASFLSDAHEHDPSLSSHSKRNTVKNMVGLWNKRNRPTLNASPIQPPTNTEKEKLEAQAEMQYNELRNAEAKVQEMEENMKCATDTLNAETTNTITLTPREAELVYKISETNKTVAEKTHELQDLSRQREDMMMSLESSSKTKLRTLLDDSKTVQNQKIRQQELRTKQEIERAMRARELAEIEARRLADEKRAFSEAMALSKLERDAEEKQRIAEEAVEKARRALERIREERHKMYAKMIAEGETQAVAEVEQVVRSQAEDYCENKPPPTDSELQKERWAILRTEARSVMTRRVMAGWTPLPELCRGTECESTPLLTNGNITQCVVCGGCGNGQDGVYAIQILKDDKGDENDEHVALSQEFHSKEEILKMLSKIDEDTLKPPNEKSTGSEFATSMSPTGTMSLQELQEDFDTKRDMVSKEISKRMTKGWSLLDSTCPRCVMPLMTDASKESEICVLCGLVGKLANPVDRHKSTTEHGSTSSKKSRQPTSLYKSNSSKISTSSNLSGTSSSKRRDMITNVKKQSSSQKASPNGNTSTTTKLSTERSEKNKHAHEKMSTSLSSSKKHTIEAVPGAKILTPAKSALSDEGSETSSISSKFHISAVMTVSEGRHHELLKSAETGSPCINDTAVLHDKSDAQLVATIDDNSKECLAKKNVSKKSDDRTTKESSLKPCGIEAFKTTKIDFFRDGYPPSTHEPEMHTRSESLAKMIANLRETSSAPVKGYDPPAVANSFFVREGNSRRERPLSPGGTRADLLGSMSSVRESWTLESNPLTSNIETTTEMEDFSVHPVSADNHLLANSSTKLTNGPRSTCEREDEVIIDCEENGKEQESRNTQGKDFLTLQIPTDCIQDEQAIRRLIEAAKSPIHESDVGTPAPERHRLPSPGLSVGRRPRLLSSPPSQSEFFAASGQKSERITRKSPHPGIESIVVPMRSSSFSSGSGINESSKRDAYHARRAPSPGLEADVIQKTYSSASSSHFKSVSESNDGSSVYGVGPYGYRIAPEKLIRTSSMGKTRLPPYVPGHWIKPSPSASRATGQMVSPYKPPIPRSKHPRHPEDQPVIDVELLIQDVGDKTWNNTKTEQVEKIDLTSDAEHHGIVEQTHEPRRESPRLKEDPPDTTITTKSSENRDDDDFTLFERQKSHSREDSSVNTDTLEALLSRIERTKSQMEQSASTKPKSKGDRKKSRKQFRGLVHDLSRAAEEMERLEKRRVPSE